MSITESVTVSAAQVMAVEIVSELLSSTSPEKLGEALTEHLRELTGAKTVMVLVHMPEPLPDEILHISPIRRISLFTPEELSYFCFHKSSDQLPFLPENFPLDHPLRAVMTQASVNSVVHYPLRTGGELVGTLVLLDLPGIERIAETNQILHLLAPPIALALRNALAFRQIERQALELEQRVGERTASLREKIAEVRQSEERHRTILRTAIDGIWLLDSEGHFIEVNESYSEMSGYSIQELLTMSVHDVEATETAVETDERINEIMQKGKGRFESRHRRKDGTLFDVEVSVQYRSIENGTFVVFIHDITNRKQYEADLLERENQLRTVADHAPVSIAQCDREQRYKFVNKSYATTFGLQPADLIGRSPRELLGEDAYAHISPHIEAALSGQSEEYETDLPTTAIGARSVHVSYVPERDDAGHVVGFIAAISDITEQKKIEEQLRQSLKLESIGRLAGGVAHDFNNMLTVIMGHAQLGLMHLDPKHPVCKDLEEIRATAERSADLTRQLLAFARKQTVELKVLDLDETITASIKMLQRLIGENIKLTWQPASKIWQIKMDPSQIDQILANLCVNARDAIEDTGQVTIETENRAIDSDYCSGNLEASPGDYVCLSVSDTGCGIAKEALGRIFEPFFTTKELGKGTGLGLATVYGAVKQNNGFMNVYSEPGQGTTFSIYLPRYEGKSTQKITENIPIETQRGQETILLVEDEAAILNIAAIMLEKQGYAVIKANSPAEALQIARNHRGEIHLLMTDVIMPEMNGRDLAKNLLSLYPDMKRLFMSGYTADVIAQHGVLEQGVYFIQKPFSLINMASIVREVLDSQ